MVSFNSDIVYKVNKKSQRKTLERMSFSEMLLDLHHHPDCPHHNTPDTVTMGLPEGVYI